MKVALGVRKFYQVGGQEQFSMHLAAYLAGRGHEVIVYTFQGNDMPNIQLNRLPLPTFRPRFCRDWATGNALAQALLHTKADVTFGEQKTWGAHVVRPGGGVEAEYWDYKLQRKWHALETWVRPLYLKRWYDLSAERRSLLTPRTRAIIANSHYVKDALRKHYPSIADKIHVIHNGVPLTSMSAEERQQHRTSIRDAYQIPASAQLALFAGHDFHRKGLGMAIEALAQAHKTPMGNNWHLLICGRGHTCRYQRQAKRLGIEHDITFADRTYPCKSLYMAADLLLLPSYYDPFANVTVEALGAGIPVITTTHNGGSEIIQQAKNGWVVSEPTDIQQIAQHLLEATNPTTLQNLKQNAQKTASNQLIQNRLSEVEALLTQVAQSLH